MNPQVLFERVSPLGNVPAVVEDDGRVVLATPKTLDRSDLQRGLAPQMTAPYCRHSGPYVTLDVAGLRVVWFEEGHGAALLDEEGMFAIIPPWSGMGGFDGYARDCIGEGPVARHAPCGLAPR